MYIEVKALPQSLQRALDAVGYRRKDVEVVAKETASTRQGGAGQRGVTAIVNIDTGEYRISRGSWGGSNPFERTADDVDFITVYPEMAVVEALEGGSHPTIARIVTHPSNMATLLPTANAPLSERELTVLYAFRALKGGDARKRHFAEYKIRQSEIDALEAKGLIKSNKAGATQITTEGRNAFPRALWYPPSPYSFSGMSGAWSPPWSR